MATLGERAGAIWLAWKWVLMLGAALAASLGMNYWQHRRALTAPYRAEVKELREAVRIREELASGKDKDDQELLEKVKGIASQRVRETVIFRQAAAAKPLDPNCAPGKARMDAVNAGADP